MQREGVQLWRRSLTNSSVAFVLYNAVQPGRNSHGRPRFVRLAVGDDLRLGLAPPLLYDLHEGFSDALIGRYGASDAFAAEIAPFDVFLLVARPARSRLLRTL